MELTDDSGGEKLARHQFRAPEECMRYVNRRAQVVLRFNPATLRTCDEKRRRIYLGEKEAGIPKVGPSNLTARV